MDEDFRLHYTFSEFGTQFANEFSIYFKFKKRFFFPEMIHYPQIDEFSFKHRLKTFEGQTFVI